MLHTEKAFANSIDSSKIVSGNNVGKIQSSDDEVSITLSKTSFEENEYILEDWFDIDNNAFDDIKVFGQRIDSVQCIFEGDNAYWQFDTEGRHGVIVEISNSKDSSVEPVIYEIGSSRSTVDKIPVEEYTKPCIQLEGTSLDTTRKVTAYDTIKFFPEHIKCINPTEQTYILHLARYLDGSYIRMDFINEHGQKQDLIYPFGQQRIYGIKYLYNQYLDEAYWEFATGGGDGVIVEISNSKDASVRPVTYEVGNDY